MESLIAIVIYLIICLAGFGLALLIKEIVYDFKSDHPSIYKLTLNDGEIRPDSFPMDSLLRDLDLKRKTKPKWIQQ